MIVLVEIEEGKFHLDTSFAGYMGAKELKWLGSEHEVRTGSLEAMAIYLPAMIAKGEVLPIGSGEFVQKACEMMGVKLPKPLNIPDSLMVGLGRFVWTVKRSELKEYPCFVKPLEEMKLFTGFVAKSEKGFDLYPELQGWDGMLFCSEVMGEIISEWRCYVLNGKVFNCSCYGGDALAFPDKNKILELVAKYKDSPAGYSLDVAVCSNGETELIECNDAWALGYYGGEFVDYFKMVKARWLQILKLQKSSLT